MHIHQMAKALVAIDQLADFIPVISTLTNLVDLSQKIIMDIGKMISNQEPKNYYHKNIDEKSYWQCMCGLIPVVGNAIIGSIKIYDRQASVKEVNLGDEYLASGDKESAVEHFLIAAKKGNVLALYKLGTCQDNDECASEYFTMAAEKGNTDALIELGNIYLDKMIDLNKHGELLEREGSWVGGKFIFYHDRFATDPNGKRAFEFFQEAAQKGNARGMFKLGCLYVQEEGVFKNDAEAVKLFKNAADKGDPDALFTYGCMLKTGKFCFSSHEEDEDKVVEIDRPEAVKYFEKSAEKGYLAGYLQLAECYEYGLGVEKDPKKAQEYQKLYDKALRHAFYRGDFLI